MKRYRFSILAVISIVTFGAILMGCGDTNNSTGTNSSYSSPTSSDKSASVLTASNSPSSTDPQVIHVTAKFFSWTLDKSTVKKGVPVKMIIKATEGSHAFTIQGTTINNVPAEVGKTQEVTFTPESAGDLTIICTHFCGTGHPDMHSILKVVD